jgi:predicted P-loop ATPase
VVGLALVASGPGNTCRTLHLSPDAMEDKGNHLAVEQWMGMQGMTVSYDAFADRIILNGKTLTDDSERKAWFDTREISNVKFPKELFGEVVRNIAYANTFHPLCDWLDEVEATWDGVPRMDDWLTRYLGVPASSYSAAVGAIFLTAAVRRARQPGCKFDELLVLEGPQGINKSSAMAALCPSRDWFSEDFTVSMNSKELLEATQGKWIVEAPELSKLNNSEVEHVKHLLSRQWDRARMAYARSPIERGRQWVGVATVNADTYLSDPTGNRRFWPVRCGTIDLAGIERDHAQLWAEAAIRERAGGITRMPEHLWSDAAHEQAERVSVDPVAEVLIQTLGHYENGKIRTDEVWAILGIPVDRRNSAGTRVGIAMRQMGWTRRRAKSKNRNYYAYYKGTETPEIGFNERSGKYEILPPELISV